MIVLTDPDPIPRRARGCVVTIGNFDGVHRGHRKIIRSARSLAAARGTRTLLLTFQPHPAALMRPERAPVLLTTPAQKRELLGGEGLDFLHEQAFDERVAALTPQEWFEETLVRKFEVAGIVVGDNFCFGRDRSGTVRTLIDLSRSLRVMVEGVPMEVLPDGTPISSSRARAAVAAGDVETVAKMLGRPYFIDGTVVGGAGRGKGLGFATANLESFNPLLPGDGVYVTQTEWGGRRRQSVTNVGLRPTFAEGRRAVESHVLDLAESLLDETVRVHFHRRLREERKFSSPEELRQQIARDVETARAFFAERG